MSTIQILIVHMVDFFEAIQSESKAEATINYARRKNYLKFGYRMSSNMLG
jgi:hypothetical protein